MGNEKHSTASHPATTAPELGDIQPDHSLPGILENAVFAKPIQRFSIGAMANHSQLLGEAGELLDRAYRTLGAIETCAQIVRSSQIARESGNDSLSRLHEDDLLCAIGLLSSGLHEDLCCAADAFDDNLQGKANKEQTTEGGVQ